MPAYFRPEALRFLRGLVRHNDREWFEARRETYERELKEPMLALVEAINGEMESFAPEHVRPPHKTVMRIYRDTRFSKDKRPYKHHMAAWWAQRGMEKTSGGGFYLQVSADAVLVAAGVYMPEREQMLAIRRWMADHHAEYRNLLELTCRAPRAGSKASPAQFTGLQPEALRRMPKGFPADHPADELLRAKNWGVHTTLPAEAAMEPGFAQLVAALFRRSAPVVTMLNDAITRHAIEAKQASPTSRKPLF